MEDYRLRMFVCLLSICLVKTDSDCIAGINSQVVERRGNITFSIDTKPGKEYSVYVSLNDTLITGLTCRNGDCKLDSKKPGILIVYENGSLIIMNASRLDEGIYMIRYFGGSLKKNETEKCFNVTVIDDGSQSEPPSIILTIIAWVVGVVGMFFGVVGVVGMFFGVVGVVVGVVFGVVGAVIFVINWRWPKKRNNSDADVGAGDSGVKNLLLSRSSMEA